VQNATLSIDDKGLNGAGGPVHESTPPSAGFDEPAKGPSASAPDPDSAKKLGDFRGRLQASFAKVVITMMTTPRYKHCSLSELEHLVLDPLLRNRVAIAEGKSKDGAAPAPDGALAGIAIWAKVSPEVDAKIREQIAAKVFPIRLKPEDWASGEIAWLLDVIAPNPKLATAVLAIFRQTVKEGQLFVHPIVRDMVDPGLLKAGAGKSEAGTGRG
jgi:cytolysin-activating lysine-acyltransferase